MAAVVETPSLERIRQARDRLAPFVRRTPLWPWVGGSIGEAQPGCEVLLKLELFQAAGSFKPRGALNVMLGLAAAELARGVTAVSAGNHAMAVAWAARAVGTTAKVVMPERADPFRVAACESLGAQVVLVPDVHVAFETAQRIEREEGRTFVHPFEGPEVVLGTATLGLELCEQAETLDSIVVPIGGGGLCAGVASAVAQIFPDCRVFGVEPEGADSMHRSFAAGAPRAIDEVRTIADSLGAPYALPHTFELCRRHVDELVRVTDEELRGAMRVLFEEAKLAVEPAGAATTAAALGPLRGRLGSRSALIVCGANIGVDRFRALCSAAQPPNN